MRYASDQESARVRSRAWLWLPLVAALALGWFVLDGRRDAPTALPDEANAVDSRGPQEDGELGWGDSMDRGSATTNELVAVDVATNREVLTDTFEESDAVREEPPAVTGRVLDLTGAPAVGAEVWLRSGGWYSTLPIEFGPLEAPDGQILAVCDGDGRFEAADGLNPGASLSIAVTLRAHAVERRLRIPFPSAPRDLGDIQLQAGRRLRGTVLDESGRPFPGAAVLLAARRGFMGLEGSFDGIGREAARTDATGRFEIDCLTPGPWHLYFDAEGYQVEARSGVLGRSDVETLEPVRLATGHSLSGEVLGWPSEPTIVRWVEAIGTGPAGARPRRCPVDRDGSFHIRGVAPSEAVTVRLVKAAASGGFEPSTEAPPTTAPSNTKDVKIHFGKQLTLSARVVDPAGLPVESYRAFSQLGYFGGTHEIGGEGPGESLEHHPGGELRTSGLRLFSREAEPRLLVQARGFFDYDSGGLKLEPGTALRLDPVTLEHAPFLRVKALGPGGAPVKGAKVTWNFSDARDRNATTDASGMAALTAAANGPSTLTVSAGALCTEELELTALEGQYRAVTIDLEEGCALSVQLIAPPAPSVAATLKGHRIDAMLWPSSGAPKSSTAVKAITDRHGLARWEGLRPGRYRVRRVPPAREPQAATVDWLRFPEVTLTAGRSAPTLTLVAPATGSLTGLVKVEGRPLPVATLRLSPTDERNGATGDRDGWRSRYNQLTDSHGRFRYDGIAVGEYTMEIEHDDHAMIARWPVKVTDGATSLEVLLRLAPIVVTVVREDGSPITGASVRLVPDAPRYVGHNDGRRAWLDERGDLQQAWHQKELGQSFTNAGGVASFPGCVPGLEGRITVVPKEGLAAPVTRFRVEPTGSDYRIIMTPPPKAEDGAESEQ